MGVRRHERAGAPAGPAGPAGATDATDATGATGPGSADRLLRDAVREARGWIVPIVLLSTLGSAAALALPALLGRAVDRIVTASRAGDPVWPAAGTALTATAALVVFVVVVDVVANLVTGTGIAEATGQLRRRLAARLLVVGPDLARSTSEGDLVTRLVSATATAAKAVVVASGFVAAVLPPAGAVVALGLVDPWLALTFAAGMVLATGAVRTYLRGARAATAGYLEAQGQIAGRLVDALTGARTIAAARTRERELDRVLLPLGELRRQGTAVWENIARLAFRGEPVVLLTQVAVIAVAGYRMSAGHLSAGELLAASRYAVMAAGIGGMLDELAALTRARAAAERIAEVLDAPAAVHGTATLPPDGPGALSLRGVTAGGVGAGGAGGRPVVDGLDLEVPGGAMVALVGRSGTGKSLVAALAGRLCDPAAGEVLLDGVPLTSLDRGALRQAVAYAFERPVLLNGTIADAIRFGPSVPPVAAVQAAARAARVDTFVARLPDGYAAKLTETPLSGGELQRIGLARALAHEARVLILDDATSSLDTATEAQIAGAITDRMRGRTRLVVTHRRATAARADLVAWLDGGRIRACAPHAHLWDDPAYRGLFRPDSPSVPSAPAGSVPHAAPALVGAPAPDEPLPAGDAAAPPALAGGVAGTPDTHLAGADVAEVAGAAVSVTEGWFPVLETSGAGAEASSEIETEVRLPAAEAAGTETEIEVGTEVGTRSEVRLPAAEAAGTETEIEVGTEVGTGAGAGADVAEVAGAGAETEAEIRLPVAETSEVGAEAGGGGGEGGDENGSETEDQPPGDGTEADPGGRPPVDEGAEAVARCGGGPTYATIGSRAPGVEP